MDREKKQNAGDTEESDDKRVHERQRERQPDLAAKEIDDPQQDEAKSGIQKQLENEAERFGQNAQQKDHAEHDGGDRNDK